MLRQHEIEVRVRYKECDPMGLVHHANYFVYFEMGRTEMLRACGGDYRQMEQEGCFIVAVKAECRYHRPARYDEVLRLVTTIVRVSAAKIEHEYKLLRGEELLATGNVVLAMVDRAGKIQPIPEWLRPEEGSDVSREGRSAG